jgi:hypothetical protein
MNSLYLSISKINSADLFIYINIILVSLIFFNKINIKFKSFVGILYGLIFAYYIYNKKDVEMSTYDEQLQDKLNNIMAHPTYFNLYDEIIDLFYDLKIFYNYNKYEYLKCIQNVDLFLKIYNDIKIGIKYCDKNIDIILDLKQNALNNLHSMIYSIENNKIIENKLKNGINKLNNILISYEKDMINICNRQIENNGYYNDRSYINRHNNIPEPISNYI